MNINIGDEKHLKLISNLIHNYGSEGWYGKEFDDVISWEADRINSSYSDIEFYETGKEILIMCDSDFINNSSGIYTFVKYCSKLFNDLGHKVVILTEKPCYEFSDEIIKMNIECIFPTEIPLKENLFSNAEYYSYVEMQEKLTCPSFKNGLNEYLAKGNRPSLIIANSYSTTKALIDTDCEFNKLTYTHIGDLLDEGKKSMYDFDDEITQKYLELYKNSDINIGTQCYGVKEKLNEMLDIDMSRIFVLNEPYYILKEVLDLELEKDGMIIISGNYTRKNYPQMLEVAGRLNIPVTIVCGNFYDGGYDLYSLIHKYNIRKYRIVENLCNDYIHTLIMQHKLMIHLSHIEVFPYAVLEGLTHIPVVINGSSIWGKAFLDDAVKVDVDDIDSVCNTIMDIYEDTTQKTNFDINKYQKEVVDKWGKFLDE